MLYPHADLQPRLYPPAIEFLPGTNRRQRQQRARACCSSCSGSSSTTLSSSLPLLRDAPNPSRPHLRASRTPRLQQGERNTQPEQQHGRRASQNTPKSTQAASLCWQQLASRHGAVQSARQLRRRAIWVAQGVRHPMHPLAHPHSAHRACRRCDSTATLLWEVDAKTTALTQPHPLRELRGWPAALHGTNSTTYEPSELPDTPGHPQMGLGAHSVLKGGGAWLVCVDWRQPCVGGGWCGHQSRNVATLCHATPVSSHTHFPPSRAWRWSAQANFVSSSSSLFPPHTSSHPPQPFRSPQATAHSTQQDVGAAYAKAYLGL